MNRCLRSWSLLLPFLWVAVSCGDDEEESDPVAPAGPAALAIASLAGSDGVPVARDDVDTLPVCRRLSVVVAPANFTLRPPGTCGSIQQCGHVAVRVDPVEGGGGEALLVEAATNTLVLDLAALDPLAGPHRLRAELRRGDRSVYAGADGVEVADEVSVEFELACDEGAGGTGGAGGGAGAPSTAGQGGGGAGGQGGQAGGGAGGQPGAGAGGQAGAAGASTG